MCSSDLGGVPEEGQRPGVLDDLDGVLGRIDSDDVAGAPVRLGVVDGAVVARGHEPSGVNAAFCPTLWVAVALDIALVGRWASCKFRMIAECLAGISICGGMVCLG